MRAASAADTFVRRATQCSFSSAFHITGSQTRGFAAQTERVYVFLIAPAICALGAATLWRLVR